MKGIKCEGAEDVHMAETEKCDQWVDVTLTAWKQMAVEMAYRYVSAWGKYGKRPASMPLKYIV